MIFGCQSFFLFILCHHGVDQPFAGAHEGAVASAARELSARLKLEGGFRRLEPTDAERLPARPRAFLTRPDGIVAWADSGAEGRAVGELAAAIRRVL